LGEKIKIAIYTGSFPAPVFIENLINAISKYPIEIYIFGKKSGPYNVRDKNILFFPTPNSRYFLFIFVFKEMIRLFIKNPKMWYNLVCFYLDSTIYKMSGFFNWWGKVLPIVNNPPDIFHIQWAKSLTTWHFLKDIIGVKLVLSLRGAHINYSPLADESLAMQYRTLFPRVDAFHAVSDAIAKETKKYLNVPKKIHTIYSACDIHYLQNFRKNNLNIDKQFRLVSIGRHHWKKGYNYAVSAVDKLVKNNIDIRYTIITKNEPSEEILYQVNELSLNNIIHFEHTNSQREIYKKMKSNDCLILPSVEEGIANVVLEAMAIGLPVISSNCGGMEEVIHDGINGFIFQNRNVDNLYNKIKELINLSKADKNKIAEKAMKSIQHNNSIEIVGDKMYQLYNSIVDK